MTLWFTRTPGQTVVSEQDEEDPRLRSPLGHAMLIGADCPDHIRVPEMTPHVDAGREFRVAEVLKAPCPQCCADEEDETLVRTYTLHGSELIVGECLQGHGFLWYRLPPQNDLPIVESQDGDYAELVDETDDNSAVQICRKDGGVVATMTQEAFRYFRNRDGGNGG